MSKKLLPIISGIPETISFSALSDHHYCSWYYKLVDLERLKPWKNTPDTVFGTYIHKAVQDVSQGASIEDSIKFFKRKWKKLCGIYKKSVTQEEINYVIAGENIINQIFDALKNEFGNFTVMKVEERLFYSASEKYPQKFKGFIDILLKLESGKIIIADFKTSGSMYFFERFKETYKDYQISLYKHFYCLLNNINSEDVETYFIVLEKNPKSKKPINFLRVSSGHVKLENAVEWMEHTLSAINRKVYVKNFSSCLKYGDKHPCVFLSSPHCRNKRVL